MENDIRKEIFVKILKLKNIKNMNNNIMMFRKKRIKKILFITRQVKNFGYEYDLQNLTSFFLVNYNRELRDNMYLLQNSLAIKDCRNEINYLLSKYNNAITNNKKG